MNQAATANVAAHLPEMARLQPETPAIYIPNGHDGQQKTSYVQYTFAELDQESSRMAAALESSGIKRGVRTVLMVPPGFEFFTLTFALFKIGAVPVLVDPGMGVKNLKTCLAEAQPEAFIGIPKAHLARVVLGWGKPTVKILITVGRRLFWGGSALEKVLSKVSDDQKYDTAQTTAGETAAILFTSGSTGVPKGAVYSHGNFSAQVDLLRQIYDIRPGEIDLPTFPLFALFAPALGMTSVVPEMDFTRPADVDPVKIIAAIEKFQITTMFGSPALINRVGRYGEAQGTKLPSLKRAISAGAPVPAAVLQRFTNMLSAEAQVFTPYGATEALPVCSIGSAEILGETCHATDQGRGVCVGKPVPGIELEIIAISDEPIASWNAEFKLGAGEIGEIIVKGPQVTQSYFNRSESTALGKIADAEHDGFYHRMGDLGYRDELGRIWFCGRKAHRVMTAQETLFTIPCEAIFNTHPAVFRTALVGVGEPGQARAVLCVELEKGSDTSSLTKIHQELVAIGAEYEVTRNIKVFLFHPEFPVDIRHNAKIFREKLAVWAGGTVVMKALVTGGGGFLGKAIIKLLVERGDQVRSFSRNPHPALTELGVEHCRGELGDVEAVKDAAAGCDIVFHVAAKAGVWGPYAEFYAANVLGTKHVIDACRQHGIKRLVHTSSPSVVFDGTDMEGVDESVPYPKHFEAFYPQTKAEAEQLVLQANGQTLATVALRPHLIWGPEDNHLVPRILERGAKGALRKLGTRECLADTIYIDNAAVAHLQAADHLDIGSSVAGKVYFLSQGEPLPIWDVVNRILDAGGLPPVTRTVSPEIAYKAGAFLEKVYTLFKLKGEPRMTRFVAKELSTAHWFDLSAARRDFGYQPEISFDEGIERLRAWLVKN